MSNEFEKASAVETRRSLKGDPGLRIEALSRSVQVHKPGETNEAIVKRAEAFEAFLTREA
jgi:hypothetical protein